MIVMTIGQTPNTERPTSNIERGQDDDRDDDRDDDWTNVERRTERAKAGMSRWGCK
jgi:hypothetical protein